MCLEFIIERLIIACLVIAVIVGIFMWREKAGPARPGSLRYRIGKFLARSGLFTKEDPDVGSYRKDEYYKLKGTKPDPEDESIE
jgi:hypothetical protein